MMPGMIQRAHGTRTTNTRPPTLKPARAKAHRPYAPGMGKQYYTVVNVVGGAKGTGKPIARAFYYADRLADAMVYNENGTVAVTRRDDVRERIIAIAAKHGYTVEHWPKELRPQ